MGKYFVVRISLNSNSEGASIDTMKFSFDMVKKLYYFRSHHKGDSLGYLN
jgi:hypothetical protein